MKRRRRIRNSAMGAPIPAIHTPISHGVLSKLPLPGAIADSALLDIAWADIDWEDPDKTVASWRTTIMGGTGNSVANEASGTRLHMA